MWQSLCQGRFGVGERVLCHGTGDMGTLSVSRPAAARLDNTLENASSNSVMWECSSGAAVVDLSWTHELAVLNSFFRECSPLDAGFRWSASLVRAAGALLVAQVKVAAVRVGSPVSASQPLFSDTQEWWRLLRVIGASLMICSNDWKYRDKNVETTGSRVSQVLFALRESQPWRFPPLLRAAAGVLRLVLSGSA